MVDRSGKNLVFLVSAPRSGSTMLGAMLGSIPGVVCPPETWIQLLLSIFEKEGPLVDAPFDHRLALSALFEIASSEQRREAARAFARVIYNDLLAAKNGSVLIDKTPRYYHILPQIQAMWPEAHFIWVQRNPLDIVASCKDTWSISIDEQMGNVVTPHTFDSTASFDRLIHFFAETSSHKSVVRYEDLVANPEPTLAGLTQRLGFSFNPDLLEYGKNAPLVSSYQGSSFGDKKALQYSTPHRNSVDRWRSLLSREELSRVLKTLGRSCFDLQGYSSQLEEACAIAGLRSSEVTAGGEWAARIQNANTSGAAEGSVHFSALRTIKEQATHLDQLQAQFQKATRELHACFATTEVIRNERNLLAAQLADLQSNFDAVERDRIARGLELASVYPQLETYKNERNLLAAKLADLQANFDGAEAERKRRVAELMALYPQLETHKNERNLLAAKLADLQANFDGAEAERKSRVAELMALYPQLEHYKNERNFLVARVADLERNFDAVETDRKSRGAVIERLGQQLSNYELQIDQRLRELATLYPQLDAFKNERNLLGAQLAELRSHLTAAEADRTARGAVIERQGQRTAELEKFIWELEQDRDRWRALAEPRPSIGGEKTS
jgi:predicted  nucleic acid-binding Zn-ribbon protein